MVAAAPVSLQASAQLAGEGAPVADVHFHSVEPRSFRFTLTGRF